MRNTRDSITVVKCTVFRMQVFMVNVKYDVVSLPLTRRGFQRKTVQKYVCGSLEPDSDSAGTTISLCLNCPEDNDSTISSSHRQRGETGSTQLHYYRLKPNVKQEQNMIVVEATTVNLKNKLHCHSNALTDLYSMYEELKSIP